MATTMKAGTRVKVPWGLGQTRAIVKSEYGSRGHRYVLVEVPVLGPNGESIGEPIIVSMPLKDVKRA